MLEGPHKYLSRSQRISEILHPYKSRLMVNHQLIIFPTFDQWSFVIREHLSQVIQKGNGGGIPLSWLLGFLVSWYLGYFVFWFVSFGCLVSSLFGFLVSKLLGFLVSSFLGFWASKFQSSKDSKVVSCCSRYRFHLIKVAFHAFWKILSPCSKFRNL